MRKGVVSVTVLVALAAGLYYAYTRLDVAVEAAIEKYGSEATQTQVRVEDVSLALTEGKIAVHGLTIANPEGFTAPHAFSADTMGIDVNLGTIIGDVVRIEEIDFREPEVFYEYNADGADNLQILQNNVEAFTPEAPPEEVGPKFLIQKAVLVDTALHASTAAIEPAIDLQLPAIEINDLLAPSGQTAPGMVAQVVGKLLERLRKEITSLGESGNFDIWFGEELENEIGEAEKKLEDLLGN